MNKVQLEGRVGRDAEVRYLPNGKQVANITLATSNDYKPEGSEEWVKRPATWHNLVAFGPDADALATYGKGDKLSVEGKITVDDWTDKEGKKRQTTKILCFGVITKGAQPNTPPKESEITDEDVPF